MSLRYELGIIISVDFIVEFYRSMKTSYAIENTGIGYSAAYPMGAERCLFKVSSFGFLVEF